MKKIVLKIGGSILSKSEKTLFDFEYFKLLKELLKEFIAEDYHIALNVGGGYITRRYFKFLKEQGEHDEVDIHKVGVATTNLNAQIAHGILNELAHERLLRYSEFDELITAGKNVQNAIISSFFADNKVLVTAPSQPGYSNDWNALQVAKAIGTDVVYNLKNIDGVYTADPRKDPSAKKIDSLTWDDYLDVIQAKTHSPGTSYPVDPHAAQDAKAHGVTFIILHGEDLDNVRLALRGKPFVGTCIVPAKSDINHSSSC